MTLLTRRLRLELHERYSPSQPRRPDGKWGSSGGFGPDPFGGRSDNAMVLAERVRSSEVVQASHDWPETKPWLASAADIEAGKVPGLAVSASTGTTDLLGYADIADSGKILIATQNWDALPPDRRAHLLYHELGHFATASALADPKAREGLLDAAGANAFDRRQPGEALAWGYARMATSRPAMDFDAGQLVPIESDLKMWDLYSAEAAFVGAPAGTQIGKIG